MPPYFFSADRSAAERLEAVGGDSVRVYESLESQNWTEAALENSQRVPPLDS